MRVHDSSLPPHEAAQTAIAVKTGITLQQYKDAATLLQCEVAAVMAVDEVESRGEGFLPDGNIKILFEPHIFWKRLKEHGLNPVELQARNESILYPVWRAGFYGPVSLQHSRLFRAASIHKVAAYESCSWGRYQIMGFNYEACGYADVLAFVDSMSIDEESHLINFCKYIKHARLDDELRFKLWAAFAEGYNGPAYKKNAYDVKLLQAYKAAIKKL